jgi:hypothetical protein
VSKKLTLNRKHEISHEFKLQSNNWDRVNFKVTWDKDTVSSNNCTELYKNEKFKLSFANSNAYEGKTCIINPTLVVACNGGHTCHFGLNHWVVKTKPTNLSLGYWFKNDKVSIGADTSIDFRQNSLNFVRLLCSLKLNELRLIHEVSAVNTATDVYDKNFILGTIIDYNDKLKLFGNFSTELTKSNVEIAMGFQYALDETTTLKGKANQRSVFALSLLKSYRKFIDFSFIVRLSTISKKTKQFNPKFNFGLSLNVADI